MALPVINLQPASAASPTPAKVTKPAGDLEFSARKRQRHYRHRHHGNAAAFGAVASMFGTVAALAAASRYRDHYYDQPYGYGYGYAPYQYGAYGYPSGGHYYYR